MDTGVNTIELAEKARRVQADHADYLLAREREREAEVALLQATIETVRPALPGMSQCIRRRSASTSGRNGCNPVDETADFDDEIGVLLVDRYDRDRDETGSRGTYGGDRLYLLDDGRLADVERTGSWSHWQGEWSSWEAALSPMTTAEAVSAYGLDNILAGLTKALDVQIAGNTKAQAQEFRDRADKLRDALRLLK
jgi:hypothetical protein